MSTNYSKAQEITGQVKVIESQQIVDTIESARQSAKGRLPILLNHSFEEVPQRFINCLTKATYVRPHNHSRTRNWELISWIEGVVHVILFDDTGKITDRIIMSNEGVKVIEIPCDVYHSLITPDYAVYLEVRNCAYAPAIDRVYAPWAPTEMSEAGNLYLAALRHAKENDIITIK